jgi:hypothetical protein
MALDVPEAAGSKAPRRNATLTGTDRRALVVDGGEKSIGGKETRGEAYHFKGTFQGTDVYLGELRTDAAGRLLFLGGRGKSASPTNTTIFNESDPNGFINADGWYDDMSDGPVTAEVSIEGRSVPVESAWVVTAPPDYAPGIVGVRTLYDLLFDLYVQVQWLPFPERVSFRDHVYPILRRLTDLQWVNRGFATQFGRGGPNDFENDAYVRKLARDPAADGFDVYRELRRQVLRSFRAPDGKDGNQLPWPWVYGDAMELPAGNSPRQNATLSPTQYRILEAWAVGNFDPDWGDPVTPYCTIDAVPLTQQPDMLDRAALEFCLADAFHPGCEVTWPVRHLTLYRAPFRIHHRPAGAAEPDYGHTLTPEVALSPSGPLFDQGPGDLTRWMGLPWQADTGYCRSGYDTAYDPFVPTFWPARVPNQVLTETNYGIAIDGNQLPEKRFAAFTDRMVWTAPLTGTTAEQMEQMVALFADMGVVEVREGVQSDPDLPPTMRVASFGPAVKPLLPTGPRPMMAAAPGAAPAGEHPRELLRRQAVREAGWESQEQSEQAPLPVRRPE